MQLDCLVFSSHKSGTQTLVHSLAASGINSRHCHVPENAGLKNGNFETYVKAYYRHNRKKLTIISVFRDPLERHISSFFQWNGTRPLERKEVGDKTETLIFRRNTGELQHQFIAELKNRSFPGREESIEIICDELKIDTGKLVFEIKKKSGLYETKKFRLFLLRFDLLFDDFEQILSTITGKTIRQINQNMGTEKWYAEKYLDFKQTLILPEQIIKDIYEERKSLIEVFYTGKFDELLVLAKTKYGDRNS
ncbi:MAG: hypothetical protein ACLFPE_05600 [Bacteroidales bacterium]